MTKSDAAMTAYYYPLGDMADTFDAPTDEIPTRVLLSDDGRAGSHMYGPLTEHFGL